MNDTTRQRLNAFLSDDKRHRRFVQICGLMTSDGVGERANASAMATAMLKEAGLTWADILGATPSVSEDGLSATKRENINLRTTMRQACKDADLLRKNLKLAQARIVKLERDLIAASTVAVAAELAMKKMQEASGAAPAGNGAGGPKMTFSDARKGWRIVIDEIMENHDESISSWERDFLTNIMDRHSLSDKQRGVLERIADKVGVDFGA